MNADVGMPSTPEAKWWGSSLTIRGAILSAASAAIPGLGFLVGLDLSADTMKQIGTQAVVAAQAVGGLAGMVMTVVGRVRATSPLTRRSVEVRI